MKNFAIAPGLEVYCACKIDCSIRCAMSNLQKSSAIADKRSTLTINIHHVCR